MFEWVKAYLGSEAKHEDKADRLEACRAQGSKAKNDLAGMLRDFPELSEPIVKQLQASVDLDDGKDRSPEIGVVTPQNAPQVAGAFKALKCLNR